MAEPDVCVVGGGPAGLMAAIALRLAGNSVLVLDANVPPIDKACGEGLLPDTLRALRELGVHIPGHEGFAFRGVCFRHGKAEAAADFPDGHAIGLRRTILHRVLTARAGDVGVELRWNAKGVRITADCVRFGSAVIRPKLTVGADGHNSVVRRAAELSTATREAPRYGFRRHYAVAPWTSYMELYWGRGCQMYITPISRREVGVALLTNDPHQRIVAALELFPELAGRLSGAQPTSPEMGAITSIRKLKSVYRQGVALVGDASGSVDAITGEGIGLAARQAVALASAFQSGRLEEYQTAHKRIATRAVNIAALMLMLGRFENLQPAIIRYLGRWPGLFERLLAIHVGHFSLRRKIEISHGCDVENLTGSAKGPRPNPDRRNSQS